MKEPTPALDAQVEKIPFKHKLLLGLIPLAAGLIRLIGWTMKITLQDPHGVSPYARPPATLYAFWHAHQLLSMFFFRNFNIQVLVSKSRDGDYIAGALESFGFGTIRSSTSSGKVTALRGLAAALRRGQHAAVTPDGPRGPVHRAQPGALFAAAMSGRPLVPFGCALDRTWRLRSWDRFEIPKPFSRAVIVFGAPVAVPAKPDHEQTARAAADLERTLQALDGQAEELLREGKRA